MKSTFRKVLVFLFAVAVVVAVGWGMVPEPVEVDLATVDEGTVWVTVDQDGKTRIREKYVVSAPLAGRLLRIEMKPGDKVVAGETLLATIEPRDPELLDARTIAQAEARVQAARVALERMEPLLEEATAAQEYAESELQRLRNARRQSPQSVSESEVESALLNYRSRTAMLRATMKNEEIAQFELDQAEAALLRSRPPENSASPGTEINNGWNFTIRSPIDGRVLRVFQESAAVVVAGTALLELGDPTDLEVEIDVLSQDAVKVEPGARVLLEHWGGDHTLEGRVRLVEPAAFTKISTLGVEEQRVNVIVSLMDPPQERTALGDGFRVEARIIVDEAADVLTVPNSALFRVDGDWAVFCLEEQQAQLKKVELGLQSSLESEVRSGLTEGDRVVLHPGDEVADGTAVRERE